MPGLVEDALTATPVFATASPAEVTALADRSTLAGYSKGDYLCREGDDGDSLLVVASGEVKLQLTSPTGDVLVLTTVAAPDCFGELALLDHGARSTAARALTDALVVEVPRDALLDLIQREPAVLDALLRLLGGHLRRLTHQLADTSFLDLGGRVAKLLLTLGSAQAGTEGDPRAELALTQTDLANMVGGTRQSVNRILADFEQRGVISMAGRTLVIRRPDVLRRRARA